MVDVAAAGRCPQEPAESYRRAVVDWERYVRADCRRQHRVEAGRAEERHAIAEPEPAVLQQVEDRAADRSGGERRPGQQPACLRLAAAVADRAGVSNALLSKEEAIGEAEWGEDLIADDLLPGVEWARPGNM